MMEVDREEISAECCHHDVITLGQRMLSGKRAASQRSGIRRASRCSFSPRPRYQGEENSCRHHILTQWNGTTCVAYRTHP
jgi:hypothetical protein